VRPIHECWWKAPYHANIGKEKLKEKWGHVGGEKDFFFGRVEKRINIGNRGNKSTKGVEKSGLRKGA